MTARLFALLACLAAARAGAAFSPAKLALVDRPFQGENLAFAPDGRHLAFTKFDGGKLWLYVVDFDRKIQKVIPLADAGGKDVSTARLAALRWANSERLILVNADSEIAAIDADGGNPVQLWRKDDAGLVNDSEFKSEPYAVFAGVPRLEPPLPDDPGHALIESVARIGAESFSNLYKVDIRTGALELMNGKLYLGDQIALYGRGDMLLWPPLPHDVDVWIYNSDNPSLGAHGLVGLQRYFSRNPTVGSNISMNPPGVIRQKLETFLSFPPVWANGGVDLNGWPPSPNHHFGASPTPPPAAQSLTPETGGAVAPDSSSSGRMIYDRQGRPRILYTQTTNGGSRTFLYTAPGKRVFEPNVVPDGLDKVLGQPRAGEFVVTPANYFGERSYPLAFDFDPDVLYIASNVGRDTYGIYSVNLATKERRELAPDVQGIDLASGDPDDTDGILVFDEHARKLVGIRATTVLPHTYWLDPDLRAIQADLDRGFPRHSVKILAWDDNRTRCMLQISAEDDPGGVFVYDTAAHQVEQVLSSTPWLAAVALNASGAFAIDTPTGPPLTGYLTLPNEPKVNPPGLIIYLEAGLWDRSEPGFNREAEILADMGAAVLRLNIRGSSGFGRKFQTAIEDGIDAVPVADLIAAVNWVKDHAKIDPKRIAVVGQGIGGYIALRALQFHPDVFRAAIGINAPTNLGAWATIAPMAGVRPMYRDGSVESDLAVDFRSIVRKAFVAKIRPDPAAGPGAPPAGNASPAMLVIESSNSSDTTPISSLLASVGIGARGVDVQHELISGDFVGGSLATRTKVFQRIDEFLNLNFYDFGSKIGELKEVKAAAPAK